MEYYNSILPYNQNDMIEVRQAEPYAYCQFIMGKDHTAFGRARHPWLTGSSGWFYTAATKYVLGIRPSYDGLIIDPCIPSEWEVFEVRRNWRGASYHIVVKNPDKVEKGVRSVKLNGKAVSAKVPMQAPGSANEVEVIMGK